ncbi:MAG: GIY-YIG nuclease family protein [Candidatus Cloacimonadota bacterium]|nr:GIY-YIG nuclease family protein [Candidatus Cloacimonadota bacterium]
MKLYYVYILTNKSNKLLYTGVTNSLINRIYQHKSKEIAGFTKKYNVSKLVYYEEFTDSYSAISREKQIKAGSRKRKLDLICNMNPKWIDLYEYIISEDNLENFTERRNYYLQIKT